MLEVDVQHLGMFFGIHVHFFLLRIFELVLSFVLDREGWCYDCVLTGKTTLYSGDCAGG